MIPVLYCRFKGGGDQHQINYIIIFIDCALNNDCPYLVCVYMCTVVHDCSILYMHNTICIILYVCTHIGTKINRQNHVFILLICRND